jgi:hypothetical protein
LEPASDTRRERHGPESRAVRADQSVRSADRQLAAAFTLGRAGIQGETAAGNEVHVGSDSAVDDIHFSGPLLAAKLRFWAAGALPLPKPVRPSRANPR